MRQILLYQKGWWYLWERTYCAMFRGFAMLTEKKLRTLFSLSWSKAVLGFPHVIFNVSRMLFYFSCHHYRRNWAPTQKRLIQRVSSCLLFFIEGNQQYVFTLDTFWIQYVENWGNRMAKNREHFLPQLIWLECVTLVKKCIKPFSPAPQRVHPITKLSMNKQIVNMCFIFTIDGSKAELHYSTFWWRP